MGINGERERGVGNAIRGKNKVLKEEGKGSERLKRLVVMGKGRLRGGGTEGKENIKGRREGGNKGGGVREEGK